MEIRKVRLDVPPVEAVQITTENIIEAAAWAGGVVKKYYGENGPNQIKIVIPTETGLVDGESYYIGDWLIRNPGTPGLVSSLGDDMFHGVFTNVDPLTRGELAEIIEAVMKTPSRTVRSLSQEAAGRIFERIQHRSGKKIRCLQCEKDHNIVEMAPKVDGDPSSLCKECESEEVARLNAHKHMLRNGEN
jgi:hypothetical protein